MKTSLLGFLLLSLLSSGCASMYKQRVNQELWERELRMEEDCIYKLRWALEDTQRRLDDANQRLGTANKETEVLRDKTGGPDLTVPPGLLGPSGGGNNGRGSDAPMLPPAPSSGPIVEPGREFVPGGAAPGANSKGSSNSVVPPELRGPKVSPASAVEPVANFERMSDRLDPEVEIERIILNTDETGQLKAMGESAPERLSVVIEERDANDKHVLAPGDVSIVVVDPAIDGRESRIARWNFDSDEVSKHVRRNREGGTLQFELPWPTPPAHSDLRLFVRFTTYDGRRLEANLPIELQKEIAGPRASEWRTSTKAAATAAGESDDSGTAARSDAAAASAPKKRSVYEPSDADNSAPPADDAPREARRNRPAWSPYR